MKSIMEEITRFAAMKTAFDYFKIKPSKRISTLSKKYTDLINTLNFWLRTRSLSDELEDEKIMDETDYNMFYDDSFLLQKVFVNEFQETVNSLLKSERKSNKSESVKKARFIIIYTVNFFATSHVFEEEDWFKEQKKRAEAIAEELNLKYSLDKDLYDFIDFYSCEPRHNKPYMIEFEKKFFAEDE